VWSDQGNKAKGQMKAPWHWDKIHQQAFILIKTTLARKVVIAYLDYCLGTLLKKHTKTLG
jgi:hypothetical protein